MIELRRKRSVMRDVVGGKQEAGAPGRNWSSAIVFLVFAVLYALTRTHYNTFDAVSYSNQIEHQYGRDGDMRGLFHPHHLLFNLTGFLLWRLAETFGYHGGPLEVLEAYNAIIAALGIALFDATLREMIQRNRALPLLLSCALGLSYGYWTCATDARVNATSTTLMLLTFMLLCRMMNGASVRLAAICGAITGLALLYHESAGLFVLVGFAAMFVIPTGALPHKTGSVVKHGASWFDTGVRIRLALAFVGAWLAIAGSAYLIVGVGMLGLHSASALRAWSTEYAELGWWWDFRILNDLRQDFYALRRVTFVEPPGKAGTFSLSPDTPIGLLLLYYSTLFGWFAAVYYFALALPLLWRTHYRPILIMAVIWMLVYGVFFTVWSPRYFVFKVPALIPITLLLGLGLAHFRRQRPGPIVNWLVAIWTGMFALVNVISSIGPHMAPTSSPFQRIAAEYKSHTEPGDLVIVAGAGDLEEISVNIPYFADRDTVSLHEVLMKTHDNTDQAIRMLQASVDTTLARHHNVYIQDDAGHMERHPDVLADLSQHHPKASIERLSHTIADWPSVLGWQSTHGPVAEIKG